MKIKLNTPVKITFKAFCDYPIVDIFGEENTENYEHQLIGDTLEGEFIQKVKKGVYTFEFDNSAKMIEKLEIESVIVEYL